MIQDILDFLTKNPWGLALVGVATLVGVGLAIWGIILTLQSMREKKPRYSSRSFNLMRTGQTTIPGIEIKFPGHGPPVQSVTVTKLILWNAGRCAIQKDDLPKPKIVEIKLADGLVFLAPPEIIFTSHQKNKFEVIRSQDKTLIRLSFDYINFKQSVVLRLYHDGLSDADVIVEGQVIDGEQFTRVYSTGDRRSRKARMMPLYLLRTFHGYRFEWTDKHFHSIS